MTALAGDQRDYAEWVLDSLEHYMKIYGRLKPDDPDWTNLAIAKYELFGGVSPFPEPRSEIPGES